MPGISNEMKFASKFLWMKWYCSFPTDESTEALWLFTSTHLYIWQLYHWNISSSETNIKVNTFPLILVQWIVNSCCFHCNLEIFCNMRRNFMVWSPVPTYSFIRGLWQWLVHMWRHLNFPLLSSQSYREPGLGWVCTLYQFCTVVKWLWSSPVPADLWTSMLWQSMLFTFGEEGSVSQEELRVMWRSPFASFANPLMCSVQSIKQGFLGVQNHHSQPVCAFTHLSHIPWYWFYDWEPWCSRKLVKIMCHCEILHIQSHELWKHVLPRATGLGNPVSPSVINI